MIDFLQWLDQPFMSDGADFEKKASRLRERQKELADASTEDFALVLFTGNETRRLFPVKTAEDVELSKGALLASMNKLPDEAIKVASYHIELASREHCGESSGLEVEGTHYTNIVYTGDVNYRAFEEKLARSSFQKEASVGGFNIASTSDVRMAERHFAVGLGTTEEAVAETGVALVKRAHELGIPIQEPKLARYDRTTIPSFFGEHIAERQNLAPIVLKPYYDELMKEAAAADSHEALLDVARCVEKLDQYAGFKPADGEKRAFSRLSKVALSPFDLVFPVHGGDHLSTSRDLSKVASVFGEEFAKRYESDQPATMKSLSVTERLMISRLLT